MKPESFGLSASRLARLDDVMKRRYVDTRRLPGLLTMIYRRGTLVHTGMSGHMDLERGKPMREDTIFRIYSMSKPITAVALMMLAEEGLIGLDDDVATHIASWKNLGVYATGLPSLLPTASPAFLTTQVKRPMKVVDLVTHTSGLTYGFMNRTNVDRAYRRRAHCGVQCRGRSRWHDRAACDAAAGIFTRHSLELFRFDRRDGLPRPEAERHELRRVPAHAAVRAAGHDRHRLLVPAGKFDRFASCYQPKDGGGLKLQDDAGKSTYAAPPSLESGGGGLVSTAHDYMRFCRMMLQGGTLDGVQILSPKTVALFSLNHLPDNKELADMAPPGLFSEAGYSGIGFSIGCGVNINVAKTRLPGTLGEFFWGGAASTAFWIDPKEDLAVVFMTQVIGSDARLTLRRDLRTLAYSAMTEIIRLKYRKMRLRI